MSVFWLLALDFLLLLAASSTEEVTSHRTSLASNQSVLLRIYIGEVTNNDGNKTHFLNPSGSGAAHVNDSAEVSTVGE